MKGYRMEELGKQRRSRSALSNIEIRETSGSRVWALTIETKASPIDHGL